MVSIRQRRAISSQRLPAMRRGSQTTTGGKIMSENNTYNGWKNRDTWNVALHMGEEPLYRLAVDYMKVDPDRDNPYIGFLLNNYMTHLVTPDGIDYMSDKLDFPALNDMMRELIS